MFNFTIVCFENFICIILLEVLHPPGEAQREEMLSSLGGRGRGVPRDLNFRVCDIRKLLLFVSCFFELFFRFIFIAMLCVKNKKKFLYT